MKYVEVTAKGCEPSVFAISEKTGKAFCYNEETGGAFLHSKSAAEIKRHMENPEFTVKNSFGKVFRNLDNWWSLEDARDFIGCLIAETH